MANNDPYREYYRYEDTLESKITNNSSVAVNKVIGANKYESIAVEPTTIIKPRTKKQMSLAKMTSLVAATTVVTATVVIVAGGVKVDTVTTDYFYGGANLTIEVTDYEQDDIDQGYIITLENNGETICFPAYCQYEEATADQDEQSTRTPILSTWYATIDGLVPGANYDYDIYHLADMPAVDTTVDYLQLLADKNNATKIYTSILSLAPTYSVQYTYSFEPNLLYDGSMTLHYDYKLFAPDGTEITVETAEIDALTLTINGGVPQYVELPKCSSSGRLSVSGTPTLFDISFTDDYQTHSIYTDSIAEYTYAEPVPVSAVTLDTTIEQNTVAVNIATSNIDFDLSPATHLVAFVISVAMDNESVIQYVEAITSTSVDLSYAELSDEIPYSFDVYAVEFSQAQSDNLANSLNGENDIDLSAWTKIGGVSVDKLPDRVPVASFSIDTEQPNLVIVTTDITDGRFYEPHFLFVLVASKGGVAEETYILGENPSTAYFETLNGGLHDFIVYYTDYDEQTEGAVANQGTAFDFSAWNTAGSLTAQIIPDRIPTAAITLDTLTANQTDVNVDIVDVSFGDTQSHLVVLVVVAHDVETSTEQVVKLLLLDDLITNSSFADLTDEPTYDFLVYTTTYSATTEQEVIEYGTEFDYSHWIYAGSLTEQTLPNRTPTGSLSVDTSVTNTVIVNTAVNDIMFGDTQNYLAVVVIEHMNEFYSAHLLQEGEDSIVFDDLMDYATYNFKLYFVSYSAEAQANIENYYFENSADFTELDSLQDVELPPRVPEIDITDSQLVAKVVDGQPYYAWTFTPNEPYFDTMANVLAVRAVSTTDTTPWIRIVESGSPIEIPLLSDMDYELEFCYYPTPTEPFDLQSVTDYTIVDLVTGSSTISTPTLYRFDFTDFKDYKAIGMSTQTASILWSMNVYAYPEGESETRLITLPTGVTIYALTNNSYDTDERVEIVSINGYITTPIAMPNVTEEQTSITVCPEVYAVIDGITVKVASGEQSTIASNYKPTATMVLSNNGPLTINAAIETNAVCEGAKPSHAVALVLYTDSGSGMQAVEKHMISSSPENYDFVLETPIESALPCQVRAYAVSYNDPTYDAFRYAEADYDFSTCWLIASQDGQIEP